MEGFCYNCEEWRELVLATQDEEYRVKGVDVTIPVTVLYCAKCKEEYGSDAEDQAIMDRVYDKYEEMTGLSADRPTD